MRPPRSAEAMAELTPCRVRRFADAARVLASMRRLRDHGHRLRENSGLDDARDLLVELNELFYLVPDRSETP